jgi:hypothetical protein
MLGGPVPDFVLLLIFFVAYFAVMRWVLPRLGVGT